MAEYLALFGIGMILGLEHALEADHIVAVVTLTSRTRSARRAVLLGSMWGLGHALTLIVIGFVILITKLSIPDRLALLLEILVGVVLIGLGIDTIWKARRGELHYHEHEHDGVRHSHVHSHHQNYEHDHHNRRSFMVGVAHGLAGSTALVLLVLSTFESVVGGLIFIVCFAFGTVIGMALISVLLSAPFKLTTKFERVNGMLRAAAGALSILVGLSLIYNIGFVGGLFLSA